MAGHVYETPRTDLTKAIDLGNSERVEALLKNGADPNTSRGDGITPLMMAASDMFEDGARMVAALLEAGADPNATDKTGMTAMDHAIFYQPPWDIVNMLLDTGFDLHRERGISSALLSEALLYDEPAVVRRLIDLGVDPDESRPWGGTALEEQIDWGGGTVENVKLLLEVGADPNRPDKAGQTPLQAAVKKRKVPVVRLLLDSGADPDRTDLAGRTPLQLARRYGYWDLVEVLGGTRPAAGLAQLRTIVGFFVRIVD